MTHWWKVCPYLTDEISKQVRHSTYKLLEHVASTQEKSRFFCVASNHNVQSLQACSYNSGAVLLQLYT